MTAYWCEHAWLDERPVAGVRVVVDDGRIVAVETGGAPATGDVPAPILPTGAGHDAGILAAAGIPTAMLFVRNPTGVSHSPDEHAEADDCLAGVAALARAIDELT